MNYSFTKRIFDISLSLILILLFLPFFFVVSILIFLTSGLPILHWSERIGQHNISFKMPKLRTMRLNTPDLATHLLKSPEKYLTPAGSFLRKTSLDEIPQLWSVLTGKMSVVGPRPALFNQHNLKLGRTLTGVSSLRPGITGWAQVNGRDLLTIEEKIKYDTYYLNNRSFLFDIYIIALTISGVASAKGINH
jgi:O-antigen biosynthesis protein WbqP